MSTPLGTRTQSIWLSQLLLAIVVVVIVLVVQAIAPTTLTMWTFTVGVSAIVVLTAVALAVPWQRLPRWAVLIIPMLDIVAVAVMTRDTSTDFAFLWVFPLTWVASYFGPWATAWALVTIVIGIVLEEARHADDSQGTLRLVVITLSLTFIAISAHITSRQTRAFKRLLRREAGRLSATLRRSKRQERQLSRVLGSIDVGVVRVSASGEVLEANETYTSLYDIDRRDKTLSSRSVEYDGYRGAPLAASQRPLARALRGELFQDVRTWLYGADGLWRALSVAAHRLPDDATIGAGESLLVAHDITAMISAERARDTLATRVSHELRNPLTTVLGYSDLVLEDPNLTPQIHERVTAINVAAERMLVLAGEILQAGRQTQAAESPLIRFDLGQVVSESIESFAPMAEASGVEVSIESIGDVFVEGDAFRLRQVSDNLLSNAIKYTDKGGSVTVTIRNDKHRDAPEDLDHDGVVLTIADTGIGMTAEDLERIYEPYYRSEAARASEVTGTGLGMGIVESLVAQHRGTLTIQSAPGRGTVAAVRLPAAPPAPSDPAATHADREITHGPAASHEEELSGA